MFDEMAAEEVHHRGMLYDLYRSKFGEYMPLVRRQDVRGFIRHKPVWLVRPLGLDEVRKYAAAMEYETARFYRKAAESARDASVRELLVKLSEAEDKHQDLAENLGERLLPKDVRAREDETARRMFVLQYVQPGLAGLMDGSVSTLAPLFAAAFATHNTWATFLVGLAASVGAGISMAFAEALSDDGSLTGRGAPVLRGVICGLMTFLGGIGHTLPYLIPAFAVATAVSFVVVAIELAAISYIRFRYMDTPFLAAAFQVVVGGVLVFVAGILIGSSWAKRAEVVGGLVSEATCSCWRICPIRISRRCPGHGSPNSHRSGSSDTSTGGATVARIHRSDVLEAIMRDLRSERPDHVAVTGDLVNIALPAEFEHARRWLEALGPPADVSLVPGNHDAYVAGAERCASATGRPTWRATRRPEPPIPGAMIGREARLLPLPARGERVGVRGPTHTLEPSKLRLADRPRCTLQPLRLAERPPHPARKSAPTSPRTRGEVRISARTRLNPMARTPKGERARPSPICASGGRWR